MKSNLVSYLDEFSLQYTQHVGTDGQKNVLVFKMRSVLRLLVLT